MFAGTADFVNVLDLESLPLGVTIQPGICPNRPQPSGQGSVPDTSFKIANGPLSAPTRHLFPRGFPKTFAVLATLRPDSDDAGNLFTIYSTGGAVLLAFRISPNVELQYQSKNGGLGNITFQDSNINDGQWHRLAFSVGENEIALILDCDKPYGLITKPSDFPATVNISGLVVLGDVVKSFKVSELCPFIII